MLISNEFTSRENMAVHRFVVRFNQEDDPRSAALLADARALGFGQLKLITCSDLYFIEGQLSEADCQRLALELLTDPVSQHAEWCPLPSAPPCLPDGQVLVDVALRP